MFIEQPSTNISKSARKPIYGVGINDAPYQVRYTDEDGKSYLCPYFQRWANMLQRVFCQKFKEKQPTYSVCTLNPSWFSFMAFRAWMLTQDWKNKELDKDILVQGNKEYGPTTCMFINQEVNRLLCLRGNHRGKFPLGVSIAKRGNKQYIQAQCSFYGKNVKLGYFGTIEEAATAYKEAKLSYIADLANKETNPKIKAALLRLF